MKTKKRQRATILTHFIAFVVGTGFGASCVLLWYEPGNDVTPIVSIATLSGLGILLVALFRTRFRGSDIPGS